MRGRGSRAPTDALPKEPGTGSESRLASERAAEPGLWRGLWLGESALALEIRPRSAMRGRGSRAPTDALPKEPGTGRGCLGITLELARCTGMGFLGLRACGDRLLRGIHSSESSPDVDESEVRKLHIALDSAANCAT